MTTHNITFNKELFYFSSKELEVILVVEATMLIELLYKPKEVINREEAIKVLIKELDLLLNKPTK